MKKIYIYENIEYGSNGPKWSFKSPTFEFRTALKGGLETAHKVARIVNGAMKRTAGSGLDNLARANIQQILVSVAKV